MVFHQRITQQFAFLGGIGVRLQVVFIDTVASRAEAWIETKADTSITRKTPSPPARRRGLKQIDCDDTLTKQSRLPRGGVD